MKLRTISASEVESKLVEAIGHITFNPDPDILPALQHAYVQETSPLTKDVLNSIITNVDLAGRNSVPLCQDTGSLVVFAEAGNELIIDGEPLESIINHALEICTEKYYLRASIVTDPLFNRDNSGNNSPAIVHIRIVEGNGLRIRIAQKGGGAENMSRLKMFNPGASPADITEFVVESVQLAGAKACPPLIIGVGIGGNFEQCALLAKEALFTPLTETHPNELYANLEKEILKAVNETMIGAQGMGGSITALKVSIKEAPCHIASLPVAVNIQCHSHRHITIDI
ncbi:MAG: fumarate hydratase [Candidatus Cloacimonetes bacterium HGW-Cloacimonetes-3]|nr:MAG: fumarate hydratase [Candidatus Cloacimonetes bacterium HGW-Cloacimonetes-3]